MNSTASCQGRSNSGDSTNDSDTLVIGGIEFDWTQKSARRLGRDLRLSPKEFYLLGLLMSNPGRVFTREHIRKIVWGHSKGDLRAVDATIARLRSSLNRHRLPDPVVTVLGYGYKFSDDFDQQHLFWLARGKRKLRLSAHSKAIVLTAE